MVVAVAALEKRLDALEERMLMAENGLCFYRRASMGAMALLILVVILTRVL